MQETLGPLTLAVADAIPAPSCAYFVDAVSSALTRMRAVGFSDEVLAGPVAFAPPDEDSAGWYESASNRLVIHARLGADTADGRRPEGYYGDDAATGFLTWAVCHELAHRIWYRGLSASGRALWQRFAQAQSRPISQENLLGIAWRAVKTCYGAPGWPEGMADVCGAFEAGIPRGMRAGRDLPETLATLGDALWQGWLKTRGYGGRPSVAAAVSFTSWLRQEGYRNGVLPTTYSDEHYKEAWAESVAALAGSHAEAGDVLGVVVRAVVAQEGERAILPGRVALSWAHGDEAKRGRLRESLWSR